MSVQLNEKALATAIESWNAGATEEYLKLYSPSILHYGLGPEPFDYAQNRGFYEVIWAAFPGSKLVIHDTVAAGDKLAARFHLQGEHDGEFMGVAPTGKPFVLPGQTLLRFSEGKVIERWTTSDMLGLMIQLGAVPPPTG